MKIILNQSKIAINKTPEIVWEREGDYAKFSADGHDLNYYGFCQYTRLMSDDIVFDGVIFGFLKASSAMDVDYRVFMTSYLALNKNEAPELYNYPSPDAYYTEISNGTVHIGTEYSDIVIQVPKTTVPTGKEVVCMIYGNGTDKLTTKAGDGSSAWTDCNNTIPNNNQTMIGKGLWSSYSTQYAMSLRLIKRVD